MIACAHQPNFLPWLGTFSKIAKSDAFVVMDNVQFARRSWVNRVRICGAGEPMWLTVPVNNKGNYHSPICEMSVDNAQSWAKKHLKTLEHRYCRAPYFESVMKTVGSAYEIDESKLSGFNIYLIQVVMEYLEIDTKVVLGSGLKAKGSGSKLIAGMCHEIGADLYLAGDGAGEYEELEAYESRGIELKRLGFVHPVYPQKGAKGFIEGLSILDPLFNVGPKQTRYMVYGNGY